MEYMIFFDLDGTLLEMKGDYKEIYEKSLEKAGLKELKGYYEDYKEKFFNYFQEEWTFPRRQAIDVLCREKNCDPAKTEKFAETWEKLEAKANCVSEEKRNVLEELSDKYKLGIITNGTSNLQRKKMKNAGFSGLFDRKIVSSEEGSSKPQDEIFESAKNSSRADEYIMVSNSIERDILPARKNGFEVVWISDRKINLPPNLKKEIKVAENFQDLKNVLGKICDK